jgi:WD40 repeat protein
MATRVLAVTAAGSSFVAPTGGGSVDLFDSRTLTRTGRIQLARMPASTGQRMVAAIGPDGRTLAATTTGGAVRFADLRSRQPLGPPEHIHVGQTLGLAFSGNGRWLDSIGADGALYIWDVHRRKNTNLFVDFTGQPRGVTVSPDGTRLVTTVTRPDGTGELAVLSVPRLALLARVRAPAGTELKFSRDGRLLSYGDDAGEVRLYDTRTWRLRGPPLAAHPGPVVAVDLSPDGRMVAATSSDGKTRLWDVPSGRLIGTLPGVDDQPAGAAFVENGTELVTMSSDGRGYVWDVRPQSWARRACEVAGRTLTRSEWEDALPGRDYAPACAHR